MKKEEYNHWSQIQYLNDIVENPLIEVGDYSYYSGYYQNKKFEDGCVKYMWGDDTSRALFDPQTLYGWNLDKLIIGNYVCIASDATILMGGNHNHNPQWISVYPFETMLKKSYKTKGNTVIKSDAWIGMKAMIMPGVTIGEGAIIASGSVVSRNVKPYEVVGGNPAQHIKMRFSESDIEKLLELRWFDWTHDQVEAAIPLISSGDIESLYQHYLKFIK